MIHEGPTVLYRFFDDEDRLLYVGVTNDVFSRTCAHMRKRWAAKAERMEVERYPTRTAALRAEARAILLETPSANVALPSGGLAGKAKRRLRAVAKRRDEAARDLARAIVQTRDEGGSLREIAEELGMSHGGVAFIEAKARREAEGS